MTSKSPVRSAEDVDEQALSYAEIKALATGNPLIIEKCELEMQVGKLNIIKSAFLSQKYALEDKILKQYPAEIKRLTSRIEGYGNDIRLAKPVDPVDKGSFTMKIGEVNYTDKKDAGTAILVACKAMTNREPIPLGHYRGFGMELSFDSFSTSYKIDLKGSLTHTVELGSDIFGNITRIDNVLEAMELKLQNCKANLDSVQTQLETAKTEIDKPFPQESELNEKTTRLNEINIALNLDEKDNEIVEETPDETDNTEQPQKKDRGRDDAR